jgi:peptide/nickel transport system permease protein
MSNRDDLLAGMPVAVEQPQTTPLGEIGEPALDYELGEGAEPVPLTQWQLFLRRFLRHKAAVVAVFVLVLLYVACFGAAWIAPYDQNQQDLVLGPVSPNADHLLGTDLLGRDTLTEVLFAGQISLRIGMAVALISTVVGTALGLLAGFYGNWVDQFLMRMTDLFLIMPGIAILALALQRFGGSPLTVTLVLAALFWMWIARVVRGQTLALKEKEFVEAARAVGASGPRIMGRHILPNCVGPIVVNATLQVAVAIITESTLSFLGFGVQPPTTSWGNMLADAKGFFNINSHLLYFPGIAILVTVLAVNTLGDGLRDALDPHAKH